MLNRTSQSYLLQGTDSLCRNLLCIQFTGGCEHFVHDIQVQRQLSEKDLLILQGELGRRQKSAGFSYVLWGLLGFTGAHKFYLDNPVMGTVYLILAGFGYFFGLAELTIGLSSEGYFFGILGIIMGAAWVGLMLWDLFTLPDQVKRLEDALKRRILDELLE